jgi:magnesium transporter
MDGMRYKRETVVQYLRTDTVSLFENNTVGQAVDSIRNSNISDQITYFYVTDCNNKLTGVLPIRKILSGRTEELIKEIMIHNVITLQEDDILAKAQQLFNTHKYLALPVVNKNQQFLGVFDITVLTGNQLNFAENHRFDDVFETIGVRTSMLDYLTPHLAFRHRFPWLLPTFFTGLLCAGLTSLYETTIAESIILTFFMTLILGLGESVSIQTLTITIRQLHIKRPTFKWYIQALRKELLTALFLGIGVAVLLDAIIILWKKDILAGTSIGLSVMLSLLTAAFFGFSIPAILHTTKLDPKVAAGPLALGLSDLCTLFFYFLMASFFLQR